MPRRMDCTRRVRSQIIGRGSRALAIKLGAGLLSLGISSRAFAGFTTIQPNPASEDSQPQVLDHIYGGAFTLEDGVDYSNGTLTAVRVSDTAPQSGGLSYDDPGPNVTDQLWQATHFQATAEAAFAEVSTTPFGYIPGASGGSFTPLFNVTGSGYAVTGSGSFTPSSQFRIAAQNPFGLLSSLPSDNTDGKDHIVTYEVDGLNDSARTWLVFFDDYGNNGHDPDFDYQDLVIQLKTVPASPSSVPEPGSMMLVGGAIIALCKRVRRPAL
jgi:hypothetical protein